MTDSKIQLFTSMIMNVNKTDIATAATQAANASLPEFGNVLTTAGINKLSGQKPEKGQEFFPQVENAKGWQDNDARMQKTTETGKQTPLNTGKAKFEQKLEASKAKAEALPENVEEVMATLNQAIVTTVCEGLNIEEADLVKALDELNLTVTDLLEPSNLAQVFSYFGDNMPVVEVLLNPDYLALADNLNVATAEVLNEFQMTLPEFTNLLQNVENQRPELIEPMSLMTPVEEQETVEPAILQEAEAKEVTQTPAVENTVTPEQVTEETVTPEEAEPAAETVVAVEEEKPVVLETVKTEVVKQEEVTVEEPVKGVEEEQPEEKVAVVSEEMKEDSEEEAESDLNENLNKLFEKKPEKAVAEHHEPMHMEAHVETQTVVTPEGTTVTQESVKVVDLQNLVTEITNYIRMHAAGNEISSIEMQLTPANLGKVLVEVVTNQGEITARIATQTEAAKEAMEANMVTLKDNLEEQGIKVNAVEVTVESHAFEENLQEDGSKEQEQLRREQEKQNRRHNLNLNEMTLEDLEGLMSEEDMVVAKMMRDNGNVLNVGV